MNLRLLWVPHAREIILSLPSVPGLLHLAQGFQVFLIGSRTTDRLFPHLCSTAETTQSGNHGLKVLKPRMTINLSVTIDFSWVFCHSSGKLSHLRNPQDHLLFCMSCKHNPIAETLGLIGTSSSQALPNSSQAILLSAVLCHLFLSMSSLITLLTYELWLLWFLNTVTYLQNFLVILCALSSVACSQPVLLSIKSES